MPGADLLAGAPREINMSENDSTSPLLASVTQQAAPVIEVKGLRKRFGEKVAVENLSFSVQQGEVFGFLGPNGAGKTTSVKMLLGLVRPSGGTGEVLGLPLGNHRARAQVGFLPEHFRFHDWLTGREFLAFHAALYGIDREKAKRRAEGLMDRVGLAAHGDKKLRDYSKGMLQRVGLAQALLNDPQLVVLDEPTSGLDPLGRRLVRDIIRELSQEGKTVFLNSHLLSEVEVTCDRVAFIKQGKVLTIRPLESLLEGSVEVAMKVRGASLETVAGLSRWSQDVHREGDRLVISIASEEALPEINRYLVEQGADVYSINPVRRSLEQLFVDIIGTDGGL